MSTTFHSVNVTAKANVYFDGKVVSHTIHFVDGSKKTLGLIYAGEFKFNTDAPERMEIIAGSCRAKLAEESEFKTYTAGTHFDVSGNSHFHIVVDEGIAEYICSFMG
jgi:uncharacterized protein YaiE (UPF0345 family)